MNNSGLSGTARVMLFSLAALFALFLAAGLAVILLVYRFAAPLPFALGMTLSSALSCVKIALLDRTLQKASDMPSESAKNYGTLQVVIRYVGTVVVLLPAIFLPAAFNVFGVIIGLLLLQLSAYVASAVIKKRPELAGLEN